jgi:aminopeptidase-like protein
MIYSEKSQSNGHMGQAIYDLAKALFPICRSITGDGVRLTLGRIKELIDLSIVEVPSGTKVFDWEVPREWNVRDAYVADSSGRRIIDFRENNLHLMSYSVPVRKSMTLQELQPHLYSLPAQPSAIPYVTSYYQENWGFCLAHSQRMELKDDLYQVVIDSELKPGHLSYGELVIPGRRSDEIMVSTYICHPSMGNNELSGPVLGTYLAKWVMNEPRNYTYRFVFVPETIGSLTYISRNAAALDNVRAGFVLTCVGDTGGPSFLPSRYGNTLADRVALQVLERDHSGFKKYSFLERGSDERQYCSPGVDLPFVSIMQSKYGTYPQYHTSLDNLDFISPEGLQISYDVHVSCFEVLERKNQYRAKYKGEPQLGKRGLYNQVSTLEKNQTLTSALTLLDFLAYADGTNDLSDISKLINVPEENLPQIIDVLSRAGLLET